MFFCSFAPFAVFARHKSRKRLGNRPLQMRSAGEKWGNVVGKLGKTLRKLGNEAKNWGKWSENWGRPAGRWGKRLWQWGTWLGKWGWSSGNWGRLLANGGRRFVIGDAGRKTALRPSAAGSGVKNFPRQGAIFSRDGLPKNFRLFPGSSWSAGGNLLKMAVGVKQFFEWPGLAAGGGGGSRLEKSGRLVYAAAGFGRAENRSGRKSGEESPNTAGRDAA